MNKTIVLLIFLFIATCANAQTPDTRNEIGVTVGTGGLYCEIKEHHATNIEHDEFFEIWSPTLSVIYYRQLTDSWSLGARMTFMHWADHCEQRETLVPNDARHYCHALMPAVRYYWSKKKYFRMHTSAAVGIALNHQIQTFYGEHNRMYIDPAYNVTLLGFEIGCKYLSGIIDFNVGTATFFSAGLSYAW